MILKADFTYILLEGYKVFLLFLLLKWSKLHFSIIQVHVVLIKLIPEANIRFDSFSLLFDVIQGLQWVPLVVFDEVGYDDGGRS